MKSHLFRKRCVVDYYLGEKNGISWKVYCNSNLFPSTEVIKGCSKGISL
jgi:hypothetical protein